MSRMPGVRLSARSGRVSGPRRVGALMGCLFAAALATPTTDLGAQAWTARVPDMVPVEIQHTVYDTLWMVGGSDDRGGISFGGIADVAVDPSGRIWVVDFRRRQVHVLDKVGRAVAVVGRSGDGPGEFRLPFQVAVAKDGSAYVFDQYQARITQFGPDLKFRRSFLLQPMLAARDMVALDSSLVISGIDRNLGGITSTIHEVHRIDGRPLHRYGKLLPARSPDIAREVGAGPMAVGKDGVVWYIAPGPYRVSAYSPAGELLVEMERENRFLPPAEDTFVMSTNEGQVRVRVVPQAAMSGARMEGDTLLVSVILPDRRVITDAFVTRDGVGRVSLELIRSTVQRGPLVFAAPELGPELFLTITEDEDRAQGIALLRRRQR